MKIKIELTKTEVNKLVKATGNIVERSYDLDTNLNTDDEHVKSNKRYAAKASKEAKESVRTLFSNKRRSGRHITIERSENSINIETSGKLGAQLIDLGTFMITSFFEYFKGIVDKFIQIGEIFGLERFFNAEDEDVEDKEDKA